MNARLYLILSLLLLSVQYSRSQFLDYIPLEHKNNSYEEKHFANVLAENLISITRDFPEIVSSTRKTR